jgi:hypothetical protein
MGPVQVLVIGFDQPAFTGEVLAELSRLRSAGIVRLVDLLVVARRDDGAFEILAEPTAMTPSRGELAAAVLGSGEDEGSSMVDDGLGRSRHPTWSLADSVAAGTTAAVALIEHTWAAPLREAIDRVGGVPLEETWLAPDDVLLLEQMMRHDAP